MTRTVPTAAAQMSTPPAGSNANLGVRVANLEDLLRSYTAGELVPGMPVVLKLDIPDGATGDVDTAVLPFGIEIDDVLSTSLGANGANANTMQVQTTGAVAISDAISMNGKAAGDMARAASIAVATRVVNAGSAIRVRRVRAGGVATARIRISGTLSGT